MRVRTRPRRNRPRSSTIAMKACTRAAAAEINIELAPELARLDGERPRVRGECVDGERPCPWVGCRANLYLDVNPETGSIKFTFPELMPWEIESSCALDLAEHINTLEEVGVVMNLTRERVRQLEVRGLLKLSSTRVMRDASGVTR